MVAGETGNPVGIETASDGLRSEELSAGRFTDGHRSYFAMAVGELIARGADGVILGRAELPILFRGVSLTVPAFDTLGLHVRAAADFALG